MIRLAVKISEMRFCDFWLEEIIKSGGRDDEKDDDRIGRFGLCLLSAFLDDIMCQETGYDGRA